jgi:arginine repressor
MGTIAGEDTLLLILRQGASHADILTFLETFIPNPGKRVVPAN